MWEWRTIARSPTGSGCVPLGTADRQEVQRTTQLAAVGRQEVGRGDRGNEARVERFGQPQPRMSAIPARAQRQLVRSQLARVEDAEDLHAAEVRRQQLAVLGERVLAKVPRVLGLRGSGRSQGQPVRRRYVGQRGGPGKALQQRAGLVDVLDRLQERDRVTGLVELLDEAALESEVRPPVAKPGVAV